MFAVKYAVLLAVFCCALPLAAQYRGIGQKESASSRASGQYMQNLVGNLLQQVKALQDENARLAEEVQRLSARVQKMQENSGRGSGELEKIRARCAAENEANRLHIKRLEKLVRDLAAAMSRPPAATPVPGERKKRIKGGGINPPVGDFVEHTVEKGHVLYHIAKAYNVTVREIKQANNLKSDSLYVGQKLLIPVKKK